MGSRKALTGDIESTPLLSSASSEQQNRRGSSLIGAQQRLYTASDDFHTSEANRSTSELLRRRDAAKTYPLKHALTEVNIDGTTRRPSFMVNRLASSKSPYSRRISIFIDPSIDAKALNVRVDSLRSRRPYGLIGQARRLVDWGKYNMSDEKIKRLAENSKHARGVRRFYEEQNELISEYEDVDKLLDTGVHYEMIQNYDENTSSGTSDEDETSVEDADEENAASKDSQQQNDSKKTENMSGTIISTSGQVADPAVASKPLRKKNSSGSNSSGEHRHVPEDAVPGNIDAKGAKVLGEEKEGDRTVKTAIYVNFAVNILLLLAKIVVVYASMSMSILASLVDSVLDLMSTLIILFANKYAAMKSARFPIGRKRLEPIGVLVFSIVIIISFLQVMISSIERLLGGNHSLVTLTLPSITIMLSTILAKVACYLWCSSIKNSSVEALTEDAKTDVVFNTFSLLFPVVEWYFRIWWIDALGACCLCLYVIIQWSMVTFEHIDHLSGSHASKEEYSQILYMIFRFSDKISGVKNYRMYHQGDLVNVEVDIVISDHHLGLRDCHDLGESLQYAIETMPYVERCFVHLDYKVRNYNGHIQG